MNTKKPDHYDIIDGPNKDVLFDACKYAYSKNVDINVDLKVAAGYTAPIGSHQSAYIPMSIIDIKISGIEHEDGSGESFNLKGYCSANLSSSGEAGAIYKQYNFIAYYNTKRRKGWISFNR